MTDAIVHDSDLVRFGLAQYEEMDRLRQEGQETYRQYARPQIYGVPLYARGTSYTNGAQASTGLGYIDLLASALGATELHNAGAGGSNTPSLPYQYVDDPAHKWTPGVSQGVVVIEASIGEALSETTDRWPQSRRVFENQILTALRWHRASAVRKFGHPSIALASGAATENVSVGGAIDLTPGIKLNAPGESWAITVGADVSEIVLLTVPWRYSAEGENGDFTVSINGVARKATTRRRGDTRPDGGNVVVTLASERITRVQAGDVVTITQDGNGTVWFYGYLEMSNRTPPPILLMQDVPLIEAGGQWDFPAGGHTPGPMRNTATLNAYRSIMQRIAAAPEFSDGRVAIADPAPTFDVAVDLDGDKVHPNNSGHDKYFAEGLSALQSIGN